MSALKNVYPPSIPSNLGEQDEPEVIFNSIGFYGDLLNRLDGQINSTEDLYKGSFYKVTERNTLE